MRHIICTASEHVTHKDMKNTANTLYYIHLYYFKKNIMKYLITLFTLAIALTTSTSVFAQHIEVTSTGKGEAVITPLPMQKPLPFLKKEARMEMRESSQEIRHESLKEMKGLREDAHEEMREIRGEAKQSLEEGRESIRKSHGFIILKQIILAEMQLNQTIKGIESRIAKMNEQGKDTTEALSHVEKAKQHLSGYATLFASIKSDTKEEHMTAEEMKEKTKEIRASLASAQQELKHAIISLKKNAD